MANYFNVTGSQSITGADVQDKFFAFTRLANLDYVRPDATLTSLVWDTAIVDENGGAYQLTATTDIQINSDHFLAGLGTDIMYGSNLSDAIVYNNGVIAGGFGSFDNVEQFWLASGDDIIDLSAHGAGGIDYAKGALVQGGQGNDQVVGGAGKDNLQGDSGDDTIFGWRGSDTIAGGVGVDVLYGDDMGFNGKSGDDTISGGSEADHLYGGYGKDKLDGGDHDDMLYGGAGDDGLGGGAGDDLLDGENGSDTLDGGLGNDRLYGGLSGDEMYGKLGDDHLEGGAGNDYMHGGGGNDLIIAGAGSDVIDGSTETDTLVFSGNRADYDFALQTDGSYIAVDQRTGSPEGTDTIRNVELFQFADGTVSSNELLV